MTFSKGVSDLLEIDSPHQTESEGLYRVGERPSRTFAAFQVEFDKVVEGVPVGGGGRGKK